MATSVQNTQIGMDITQLEAGVIKSIALLGAQGQAINNLQVKQLTFNEVSQKGLAVVEATIGKHQKLIAQLHNTGKGWETYATKVLDTQKKMDQEKPGKSFLLEPAAFARIAEATAFKQAFNSVTDSIIEGISKLKEWQIQVSLIRTVSQDAQLSMTQWMSGLKEVSNETGQDILNVSSAAYDAIQSQVVQGSQTFQFLKSASDLARTTGTNIKQTGDLLAAVMSGFNQASTEVDHTAAILFKTVELGRIKVEELVNTMGKVAPSANLIGIKFEEISAALATLTRQGIKTNDATVLVSNVVLKLAKPTEALTKLINEWGFANSQAAIRTLGFVEVLRRLEQVSGGRLGDLAEYFNELRALRGAAGLTSAFGQYEQDLAEIKNSRGTFEKAKSIRSESPSDRLDRSLNIAKNTMLEFSDVAVSVLDRVVKSFGDTETFARGAANAIIATGAALVGLKVGIPIANAMTASIVAAQRAAYIAAAGQDAYNAAIIRGATVQEALAAKTTASTAAQLTFRQSMLATTATVAAGAAQLGLLVAAIGAVYTAYRAIDGDTAGRDLLGNLKYRNLDNIDRIAEVSKDALTKRTLDTAKSNLEGFENIAQDAFRVPLRASAIAYKEAEAALKRLEDQTKSLSDSAGNNFKNYLDVWKDSVKELNKEISKTQTNIRQSKQEIEGFSRTLDGIIRDTQLQYATDQQKLQLNENYIRQLKEEVKQGFAQGTDESVRDARTKLKEIAGIIRDNFNTQQVLDKTNQEQFFRDNPSWVQSYGARRVVSTQDLQSRFAQLKEFEKNLEDSYQGKQGKIGENSKKSADDLEGSMRQLETAYKRLTEIKLFKDGKVDERYQTKGKVDPDKFYEEIRKASAEVEKYLGGGEQSSVFKKSMQELVGNTIRQAYTEMRKELAAQDQQTLNDTQKKYIDNYKKIQDKIADMSANVFSKQGALDLFAADGKTLLDFTQAMGTEQYANLGGNTDVVLKARDLAKKAQDQEKEFQAARGAIGQNATTVQGQLIPRAEDIDLAIAKFQQLELTVKEYVTLLSHPDIRKFGPERALLPGLDGKQLSIGGVKEDFYKQADALRKAATEAPAEDQRSEKLKQDLQKFYKDTTLPLIQSMPQLLFEGTNAATGVNKEFDALRQTLDKATGAAERLRDTLKTIPQGNPEQSSVDGGTFNEDVAYAATGGLMHPGKARGADTIPAWLTPGEYIMDPTNTKKFYSQLVQMSNGQQPRYYAQGGMVTTNIGDVHVHMSGAGSESSPTRMARAIGQELRREIRRGNMRL